MVHKSLIADWFSEVTYGQFLRLFKLVYARVKLLLSSKQIFSENFLLVFYFVNLTLMKKSILKLRYTKFSRFYNRKNINKSISFKTIRYSSTGIDQRKQGCLNNNNWIFNYQISTMAENYILKIFELNIDRNDRWNVSYRFAYINIESYRTKQCRVKTHAGHSEWFEVRMGLKNPL